MNAPRRMSDLEGARIVHVESAYEPIKWVLVFEHRGTDDGSGYLVVDSADVHFADGDPDAWRAAVVREGTPPE